MKKLDLVFIAIFISNWCCSSAVLSREERSFPARQLGQSLAKCLAESDSINCFKSKVTEIIDQAIANNETWPLGDFLVIEKNTDFPNNNSNHTDNKNTFENVQNRTRKALPGNYSSDQLAWKLLQLAQSRSLKFQLPSISANLLSSLKAFNTNDSNVQHGVTTTTKQEPEEGRRRKHKDKTMAMMGGMAMLAMMAQLFLGKVILVAGAAFVLAKVALLISTLGSFKRGTIGNGNDHVIVAANGRKGGLDGNGYEFHTDWHRRVPPYEYNKYLTATRLEHKFPKPSNYYKNAENDKFPRQSQ